MLPGLIDCHVHLTGEFGPHHKLETVEETPAAVALHAARHARATLEAGFTTVRDLGDLAGSGDAIFALRNAVAKGYVPGPRIFAAGSIISPTGGHGMACGYRDDVNLLLDSSGRADGVDGCRAAVRRQVSRGADFIKFVATGGVLTDTETGTDRQFFDDEYEAIIAAAKMLGRKTTAHAHGADGMKAALKAGVDAIEHGTFMDAEITEMMLRAGTVYVPTTLAGATVAEQARTSDFMPAAIRRKALEVGPRILETLARGHKAGLKIAFGTDTGVSPHGENAKEFALMVKAGHVAHGGHRGGDGVRRRPYRPGHASGQHRGRQDRRHHRRGPRSAGRYRSADACRLRDESRHGVQAFAPLDGAGGERRWWISRSIRRARR